MIQMKSFVIGQSNDVFHGPVHQAAVGQTIQGHSKTN